MFERFELIIGNKIELIKNKTVLIIGLGGVGGYALESIVRSGIGKVIIVDYDIVDETNLNRQILALSNNIGRKKVDVAYERIKEINKDCKIIKINEKITIDNIDILFREKVDYIIDACDTVETKKQIIRECLKRKIKLISSMGTGNKLDPSKLQITDIRKTSYDPVAKIIRKHVKDTKYKNKVICMYSSEIPLRKGKTIGSSIFVPATAGLMIAGYTIKKLINQK